MREVITVELNEDEAIFVSFALQRVGQQLLSDPYYQGEDIREGNNETAHVILDVGQRVALAALANGWR